MIESEQPMIPMPQGYASPLDNHGSTILLLTDVEDSIKRLQYFYMGVIEKDDKLIKVSEPIMNQEGIHSVIGQVQAVVNRITTMSSLDVKKEVPTVMKMFYSPLIMDLMLNREKYDIKRISDRNRIYWSATNLVYITCKRAVGRLDGGFSDKDFIKGSQQEIRTEVLQGHNQGLSWGKILPFRKK